MAKGPIIDISNGKCYFCGKDQAALDAMFNQQDLGMDASDGEKLTRSRNEILGKMNLLEEETKDALKQLGGRFHLLVNALRACNDHISNNIGLKGNRTERLSKFQPLYNFSVGVIKKDLPNFKNMIENVDQILLFSRNDDEKIADVLDRMESLKDSLGFPRSGPLGITTQFGKRIPPNSFLDEDANIAFTHENVRTLDDPDISPLYKAFLEKEGNAPGLKEQMGQVGVKSTLLHLFKLEERVVSRGPVKFKVHVCNICDALTNHALENFKNHRFRKFKNNLMRFVEKNVVIDVEGEGTLSSTWYGADEKKSIVKNELRKM